MVKLEEKIITVVRIESPLMVSYRSLYIIVLKVGWNLLDLVFPPNSFFQGNWLFLAQPHSLAFWFLSVNKSWITLCIRSQTNRLANPPGVWPWDLTNNYCWMADQNTNTVSGRPIGRDGTTRTYAPTFWGSPRAFGSPTYICGVSRWHAHGHMDARRRTVLAKYWSIYAK